MFEGFKDKRVSSIVSEGIIEIAKLRGFQTLHGVSTAPATLHLSLKLGFEILAEIKYEDYRNEHYDPKEEIVREFRGTAPCLRYMHMVLDSEALKNMKL